MSFTYDSLKQAIQDYTENSETTFVNNLPVFIRAAEERILKNVQLNLFMRNQQGTMTTNNQYLGAPSDFLAPFSITVTVSGKKQFLEFKDLSFIEEFNPDYTVTGVPRYYAQFDVGNFIVAPTPDQDYAVEVQYLFRPASLTSGAGTGTTWLSDNADLAMLYGSLVEAYIFMKGEQDIMAQYNQRFNEAVIGLKMLGEAKETTQDYRVGKVIRPKQ
mgnify:FL=1|jgi:hypothetical protein|tara:strand:+ start:415 stop:1062 length:648 start_codon:yes stop_codon:yes gene_type:complete